MQTGPARPRGGEGHRPDSGRCRKPAGRRDSPRAPPRRGSRAPAGSAGRRCGPRVEGRGLRGRLLRAGPLAPQRGGRHPGARARVQPQLGGAPGQRAARLQRRRAARPPAPRARPAARIRPGAPGAGAGSRRPGGRRPRSRPPPPPPPSGDPQPATARAPLASRPLAGLGRPRSHAPRTPRTHRPRPGPARRRPRPLPATPLHPSARTAELGPGAQASLGPALPECALRRWCNSARGTPSLLTLLSAPLPSRQPDVGT